MTTSFNQVGFENINAQYIEIVASVFSWEDAIIYGLDDVEGKVPCRNKDQWEAVIDLATGRVLDWPDCIEADINFKVCDEGHYWLLNESKIRVAKWNGYYVPNDILCIGDNGFGDYIILKIGKNGMVVDWKKPVLHAEEWDLI